MTRWKLAAAAALLATVTTSGGLSAGQTAPAKAPKSEMDAFAGQMWDIIAVIGKQHLEPRPRAELIVAGGRALVKAAKAEPPADLERRAAAVQTREEFANLLQQLWPADAKIARAELESAFLVGVSKRVGGELRVIPPLRMMVEDQISGNRYVGIGIQIGKDLSLDRPKIVVAMRNGPARKAGIKANDLFLSVDGKDTKGASLTEIINWLRGDEGTTVTIVAKQPDAAESRTYKLTRAVVPFDSLAGHRRPSAEEWDYRPDPELPVAYVRIESLRISTLQELRQLEPRLKAKGFRALVLDLRFSNGDGRMRNAALLADGLLDGGLMWTSHGADEKSRTEYRADRECLFRDWPLAVLINDTLDRQHALVAAALQDNGRAVLVGEPTKNDGYVDSLVTLPDSKRGLVFRTGILERAAKERGWPVKPDHVVGMDAKAKEALAEWQRQQERTQKATPGKPPADPQLARAIELMRDALKKSPVAKP